MDQDTAGDIQVADQPQQQRYELMADGQLAGFIDYRRSGNSLNLVHTEVLPEHEGRGFGARLARFALDEARRSGHKVVPSCSFIAAFVRRHGEYAEVVEGGAAA